MVRAVVLVGVTAILGAGCFADECHPGESRCDGELIAFCTQSDGSDQWYFGEYAGCCSENQCVDTTGENGAEAVCSTTGAPDPRCGGDADVCTDDGHALRCTNGYAVETACADVCVAIADAAFCAIASDAPACAGKPDGTFCEAGHVVRCDQGALIADQPCVDPASACVEPNPGHAFCATTPDPAPMCGGGGWVGWCEGGVAFSCQTGFVHADICGVTETCTEVTFPLGTSAWCDDPAAGCAVPG